MGFCCKSVLTVTCFLLPALLLFPRPGVVENITVWTSEHAVNQNSHLPVYRSTMQELGQFCVDAPEIDLKLVSLAIPGHQKSSAANTQRQEEEQAAPLTEAEMNTR